MIKKLRIKFVIIIMTIITIMLCSIMGLIYFFTGHNLETKSISMMKSIAISPFAPSLPDKTDDEIRLPYFIVRLNPMGELTTTDGGFYELTDDIFLNHLVDIALSSPKTLGTIDEYNLRYYRVDNPLNHSIVFADMSSEISTLHNLLRTCIIIGITAFLVFLFLSILLSGRMIAPVDIAFKKQRRFIADASHDLKTPLTVILSDTELMKEEIKDNNKLLSFVDAIHTMSLRMKELIMKMLELAKTEQDAPVVHLENINLSSLVSETVLTFDAVFFEKKLSLEAEVTDNIFIKGDDSMLHELMEILLDNACKYSTPESHTWIRLMKSDKAHCTLIVANEGEEISCNDLNNIFTRFYRADKSRSMTSGSGLGLSIADNIVKLHHGKIKAESCDGINSFSVRFPL